ncbi:hypothetical protein CCP4SC76_1380007 [Gammaproteobacteria bacterium]
MNCLTFEIRHGLFPRVDGFLAGRFQTFQRTLVIGLPLLKSQQPRIDTPGHMPEIALIDGLVDLALAPIPGGRKCGVFWLFEQRWLIQQTLILEQNARASLVIVPASELDQTAPHESLTIAGENIAKALVAFIFHLPRSRPPDFPDVVQFAGFVGDLGEESGFAQHAEDVESDHGLLQGLLEYLCLHLCTWHDSGY